MIKPPQLIFEELDVPGISKIATNLLKKSSKSESGCYGEYRQLSRTKGIKILHSNGYYDYTEVINSDTFEAANKEAKLLRKAYVSGITPRCYGVKLILRNNKYYVGILMEHLGTTTLADFDYDYNRCDLIINTLKEKLRNKAGLIHFDLHGNNIMWHKGMYWAIDFSYDRIQTI